MATSEVRLTTADINHLLCLLHERHEDGSYYGNRENYYKRTSRLIGKLKEAATQLAARAGDDRAVR